VRYFKIEEFDCSATGRNAMNPAFLERIDELRHRCNFPFLITSGYRAETHPIEAEKPKPGTHSKGIAADIAVSNGADRYKLLTTALQMGFTGIGVAKTFIHVDDRKSAPVVWTY
jgi:zinc D-Ala-D-Ala carboxypeptidase